MSEYRPNQRSTSSDELAAFEVATRDLVGLALRSLDQLEVSLPQFRLLLALQDLGRSSSVQVAQALGVVGSSVTRAADRLTVSGHVRRGADAANRSIVTLELTDAGRELVARVTESRRGELREVLDRLDPDERAACAHGLRRVHRELAATADQTHVTAIPL
jgi:DNA-binding MarR family transcriptional regulator